MEFCRRWTSAVYVIRFISRSSVRSRVYAGLSDSFKSVRFTPKSAGRLTALSLLPIIHATVASKMSNSDSLSKTELDQIIKRADELYDGNQISELYDFLITKESCSDSDVLWRLARATCDKAKGSTDAALKKKLMHDALQFSQRALKADENNFACHKWYAIMLDYVGEYEGTKERISKAYDIKEHFLKAITLNPKDATSVHLLGYWCFVFADLPWYQQKIASVLFATPPTSSYDEALTYFLQAESIDANFYSMNLLMIGKCYVRMKQPEVAKHYLLRASQYPIRTEDDKRAQKEATELLGKL